MNMRVRGMAALVAAAGLVSGLLVAAPSAVAAGSPGTITTVAGGPGRGPATKVYQDPQAVAASPSGALYVGGGTVVRAFSNTQSFENVVAGSGTVGYSGDRGPGTAAELYGVQDVALDGSANLFIADRFNNRIRMVAHRTGTFYGQAMKAGDIYTVAGTGASGFSGDGGPATAAELNQPTGVAADPAGNLVIADSNNFRVRVVAAKTGTFYGQAMKAGDIYTVAGTGVNSDEGDGGPATAAQVMPWSVTVDPAGNILIAEASDSVVRVVAASTGTFYGVAMTAGDIYRVAGNGTYGFSGDAGPATAAELRIPDGVAADPAGNLIIADSFNGRVRMVAATTGTFYGVAMKAGDIYTVAGDGGGGPARSGGPATSTSLSDPEGAAVDAAGNLVIADAGYGRVWVVAATTGTFYQQAMTAGHIYIVAGKGDAPFSGSGGPAMTPRDAAAPPRAASSPWTAATTW
jgi:hypothetical protein